jgi:hypothetical protein
LKKLISTIKILYCNNPNIRTLLLGHMKSHIATYENHLLQHPKIPLQHGETAKTMYKTARDGFEVQAALALGPSTSSSSEGGGNKTTEVTETLANATSLRSRGGGEGGGLRSKGGTTYLVDTAAVVLVSGGGNESRVARGAG